MTQTISRSDYYNEVRYVAQNIRERQQDEGPDGFFDENEAVHEWIDCHEYIIYTHLARQVLEHSDNDCAIFEELGPQQWEDWSTAFSQSAYFAMQRDVYEALSELPEPEWPEEEEDEEEEDDEV